MTGLLRRMQAISLEVATERHRGTYATLVLDFEEGEAIVTGVPLERGREVRIEPGTPVRLVFVQPDGLHVLSTRVVGRERSQPSLRLEWPAAVERVQRRNHARVEAMLRCDVHLRAEDEAEPTRSLRATTLDVSAGGVRVALGEPLEAGSHVAVTLHLPELGRLDCEARVVRGGAQREEPTRYWAALELVGVLESVRRELTRFVFDVQREQLRKGVA